MKRMMFKGTATAMVLLLAACGSNDENADNGLNIAAEDMNVAAADANNPFADSEAKMSKEMMAAVGTDVGDNWAKKMIAHHQGAVDMSQIVLQQNPTPDVAMMARETIEKQQKDIEGIRKLVKDGPANQQSAELYRPAMMEMHEKMMAAKGADVSETFMRKMLEHHKGAVSMSDVALQNGVSGALRAQVQKTKDDNQKDAKMVEAMLGGQSHQQAMAASGAKSAAQAKAEPAPADKAKASAAKPPAKPAAADPMAGHDMNSM